MADIDKAPSPGTPLEPLSGGTVQLHGGFEVDLDARLPTFDAGSGYAYEARDGGETARRLYAVLCDPRSPYRHKPMAVLRGKAHKNYVSVVTVGRISPIGSRETRLAVIFNRPNGVPLANLLGNGAGLSERWIAEAVVPQALAGLGELHGLGVTHRALCPDNVYYDADDGKLALGQCVTSPAGSLQPAAFEPLESAAAMPDGRGDGTPAFDMFALGVLLLALSVGVAPAASGDGRTQLVGRQVKGSFAALKGSHKLSGPFSDLIKGLTCDSPAERWGLEDIDAWVHGRRPPAKRIVAARRALRPFSFQGRDYLYDLELALDFAREPDAAAAAVDGGALDEWLRTGLRDSSGADDLAARLKGAAASARVSEAIVALDPFGPLRRGAIAVTPDGFGPVLAAAFAAGDRERQDEVIGLLASDVIGEWARLRRALAPRHPGVMARVSAIQAFAQGDALGSGAERCLYELNKSLPCQSPLVARRWVAGVPDLMEALDRAAANADGAVELLDRHVAAFAASRSSAAETVLLRLAPADSSADKRMVGLEFFAELQLRFKSGPLTGIARAFAAQLASLVAGLHGRTRRKQIKDHMTAAKAEGDLSALLVAARALLEDESDAKNFRRAAARYAGLQAEIDELNADEGYAERLGNVIGGRAATTLALVFLTLSAALSVFGIGP